MWHSNINKLTQYISVGNKHQLITLAVYNSFSSMQSVFKIKRNNEITTILIAPRGPEMLRYWLLYKTSKRSKNVTTATDKRFRSKILKIHLNLSSE